MESIAGSAVAGLIAALTATTILGAAKWIHLEHLQRLDVKQIREVLTTGRKRVMESKETFQPGLDLTLPGDLLRAAKYNLMIKQLRVAYSTGLAQDTTQWKFIVNAAYDAGVYVLASEEAEIDKTMPIIRRAHELARS